MEENQGISLGENKNSFLIKTLLFEVFYFSNI